MTRLCMMYLRSFQKISLKVYYKAGDMKLINRESIHSFSTQKGVIFEEISTQDIVNDSYYEDKKVTDNNKRKTRFTYWRDN